LIISIKTLEKSCKNKKISLLKIKKKPYEISSQEIEQKKAYVHTYCTIFGVNKTKNPFVKDSWKVVV